MSLANLIYVSSAKPGLEANDLDAILDVSRRNNEQRGLTGMLLYAGGNFIQVLEGDAAVIEEAFRIIEKDPRHHDVIVIERGPIASRSFGAWRMGFRAIEAAEAQRRPGFAPFFEKGFDAKMIGATKGLALDLLTSFRESNR